jgi:CHAD domain-containing protein
MAAATIGAMKPATSVHRYWARQLELMQTLPQAVHAREADSIHGLRAAGRRLKATVRVYQPLLRRQLSAEVIDGLDWYNSVLGQARDAEVIHQAVAEELRSVRKAKQLLVALDSERRRTAHLADKMLVGVRAGRVVSLVEEFVDDPWRGKGTPGRDDVLERMHWAEFRVARIWRQGPRNGETSTDWEHRLRRRSKVARFGAEALRDAMPGAVDTAAAYAQISTTLGVVQDTAIINRALQVWPKKLVGDLMATRERLATEARDEAPDLIDAALSAKLLK